MADYSIKQLREFWSFVRLNPKTDCWEWEGPYTNPNGGARPFPRFNRNGVDGYARRIAYKLCYGETPLRCSTTCGNYKCVCPAHMTVELTRRTVACETLPRRKKLTKKRVMRIIKLRNAGNSYPKIAKKVGSSLNSVMMICRMAKMCADGELREFGEVTYEAADGN